MTNRKKENSIHFTYFVKGVIEPRYMTVIGYYDRNNVGVYATYYRPRNYLKAMQVTHNNKIIAEYQKLKASRPSNMIKEGYEYEYENSLHDFRSYYTDEYYKWITELENFERKYDMTRWEFRKVRKRNLPTLHKSLILLWCPVAERFVYPNTKRRLERSAANK